jgi:hypothetical protein
MFPQVLVPPLVGMMVSEASLFLCTCIAFQPLSPKYIFINIDYLVNITTNICWKKLAIQLEVNVGEVCRWDERNCPNLSPCLWLRHRLKVSALIVVDFTAVKFATFIDYAFDLHHWGLLRMRSRG